MSDETNGVNTVSNVSALAARPKNPPRPKEAQKAEPELVESDKPYRDPKPGEAYAVMGIIYRGGGAAAGSLGLLGKGLKPPERAGKIHLWVTEGESELMVFKDDDEVCTRITRDTLAKELIRWVTFSPLFAGKRPFFAFTMAEAKACADKIAALLEPIERPADVLFQNQTGPTFRRIPLDLAPGPCPDWDSVMSRMTNAEAFHMWITKLFIEDAYQEQLLYVEGKGGDGKTKVGAALAWAFKQAHLPLQKAPWDNDYAFGMEGFIGKRLIMFTEFHGALPLDNATLKALTGGGDGITIHRKYEKDVSLLPRSMMLFFSNAEPEISTKDPNATRRIIHCKMSQFTDPDGKRGDDHGFLPRLKEQFGAFIANGLDLIAAKNHDPRRPIVLSDKATAALVELGEVSESLYTNAFDSFCVEDPAGILYSYELDEGLTHFFHANVPQVKAARTLLLKMLGESDRFRRRPGGPQKRGWRGFRLRHRRDDSMPFNQGEPVEDYYSHEGVTK